MTSIPTADDTASFLPIGDLDKDGFPEVLMWKTAVYGKGEYASIWKVYPNQKKLSQLILQGKEN